MIEEKLMNIQNELKAPKGQRNNFGNYNYRSCEDILEAVKPLLKKYEVVLQIYDELVAIGESTPTVYQEQYYDKDLKKENTRTIVVGNQRYYIKATAVLTDMEGNKIMNTGYAREEETKKGMDGSQITGTASSYARKYALNGLFCIDDTKDADTNEFKEQTTEQKTNTKPTKVIVKNNENTTNDKITETLIKAFKLWIQNHKIASDVLTNTLNDFGYSKIEDIQNKDYKAIVTKLNNILKGE